MATMNIALHRPPSIIALQIVFKLLVDLFIRSCYPQLIRLAINMNLWPGEPPHITFGSVIRTSACSYLSCQFGVLMRESQGLLCETFFNHLSAPSIVMFFVSAYSSQRHRSMIYMIACWSSGGGRLLLTDWLTHDFYSLYSVAGDQLSRE